MAETLTVNTDAPTETATDTVENLTPEEQDSLAVGSEIQEQQEQLYAGKYKSAEELEKAYGELQKKLGDQGTEDSGEVGDTQDSAEVESEETTEETEETPEVSEAAELITSASDEFNAKGELTPETLEKFSSMSSKDLVRPKIVAGVNALGRGQDREALTLFIQTIAQTLGAEALLKFVDPSEAIKRLAAAQGIDVLNLIKTQEQLDQEMQQQQAMQANQELVKQAGSMASSPLFDPSKSENAEQNAADLMQGITQQQPPQ